MKKKGYILYEILVGVFLMGLISTTFFPIIVSSFRNFNRVKNRTEMTYVAEMVAERLKGDKELYDEIIPKFDASDQVTLKDNSIDENKYECIIYKIKSTEKLLDLNINIFTKNQENSLNVYLKASIPKL